jgi:hypothetical protein
VNKSCHESPSAVAGEKCAQVTHHASDSVFAADHRLHVVLESLARARGCVEIIRVAAANIKFPAMPQKSVTENHNSYAASVIETAPKVCFCVISKATQDMRQLHGESNGGSLVV